jgi:hypothetical protein
MIYPRRAALLPQPVIETIFISSRPAEPPIGLSCGELLGIALARESRTIFTSERSQTLRTWISTASLCVSPMSLEGSTELPTTQ